MTLTRLVLIIFFSNLCSTSYADINSSHAISMHGIPKYENNFFHVEYANPNANKTGSIVSEYTGFN